MKTKEDVLELEICECGEKNVAQAIEIFQNTSLPFKKSKKLVTECNKNCCRAALMKLNDMVTFGTFDYDEIAHQIQLRHDRLARLTEGLKSE
jgi:penicillin V acylase-like amidase (Ntn superfamily)